MKRSQFIAGVIPTPPELRATTFDPKFANQPMFATGKSNWFDEVIPTKAQVDPSCVGRSTAQLLMALIRRQFGSDAIPKGYKLDGDFLWKSRRKRMYKGDMSGGLQLNEGVDEAVHLGWIAGVEYGMASIPLEFDYLDRMLRVTPLLLGFAISPGWYEASEETGQIGFSGLPNPNEGHAVLGVDTTRMSGAEFLVIANSWGMNWGRHGYGTLTMGQAKQQALSSAIALYLPQGIGEAWRDHLTPE